MEPLSELHDVDKFDAGARQAAVTAFLQEEALHEQEIGLARVWVALDRDDTIAGYFTLNHITIPLSESVIRTLGLPNTAPSSVAGYLLGKVGIDRNWMGQQLGDALDARAIETAERLAAETGAAFLAVDARDDALVDWYTQLGFVRLSDTNRRLIRSLH